jgi:hypothetical protein
MTATELIGHGPDGRLLLDRKQTATTIVDMLLAEEPLTETALAEATVHLPARGRVWVATFTGHAGGQVWKSTGFTDRRQAVALARRWEAEARAQRLRWGRSPRKAALRVRRRESDSPGSGLLTQKEVAWLLGMSERGVKQAERRALEKLRNHPLLRSIWLKYLAGELDEHRLALTEEEIHALFSVARTPEELLLVQKFLRLAQS